MKSKFTGVGVALVTPFNEDLSIDFNSLEKLISHVSEGGVNYLVVQGTTGENATLTLKEKEALLRFVHKYNYRKLPVVYGLGGNNTVQVLDDIKKTDFSFIDAILSVCPYYNKPSQEGIIKHFKLIADNCPVPMILYNVPGRTGKEMDTTTIIELSQHSNIIGIKEATGDVSTYINILSNHFNDFFVTAGDDMLTLPTMAIGTVGVISVLANAYPSMFAKIVQLAQKGNYEEAKSYVYMLNKINFLMYQEGNPTGVKQVLAHLNVCKPAVRLPNLRASEKLSKTIFSLMKKIND